MDTQEIFEALETMNARRMERFLADAKSTPRVTWHQHIEAGTAITGCWSKGSVEGWVDAQWVAGSPFTKPHWVVDVKVWTASTKGPTMDCRHNDVRAPEDLRSLVLGIVSHTWNTHGLR